MEVAKTAASSLHFDEGKQPPRLPIQRKITTAAEAAGSKQKQLQQQGIKQKQQRHQMQLLRMTEN
jgi:hypothetical protein